MPTYTTPGSHTLSLAADTESITVEVWGAEGGDAVTDGLSGGVGGYVEGYYLVNGGETVNIHVGGVGGDNESNSSGGTASGGNGGVNGGGGGGNAATNDTRTAYSGAGGGGASDIRLGGDALADRIAVGAGGGGASPDRAGADGGAATGATGGAAGTNEAGPGEGGTQSAGGDGGAAGNGDNPDPGDAGALGIGGQAGTAFSSSDDTVGAGGGGGAGYYGGGGGGGDALFADGGPGGGGSNYSSALTDATSTRGVTASNGGDGKIVITENSAPTAPTLDSVTVQNGDDLFVEWTDNSTTETEFVIELSRDGGSSWSSALSVGANTESATVTNVFDGEQYTVRVVAVNDGARGESGTLTATSVLPSVANLMLDASVEDELTATWDDTQDYGDYRIEIKESDTMTWATSVTEPESSTSHTFTGLKDGEQYDVRLRGETEHTTTAWLELSEVTLLPAPTDFSVGETSPRLTYPASFSWTDNAENTEGNYAVLVSTDGGSSFSEVASIADTAESYDYTATQADTTYTAKVRFETQYVTADSGTDTFISGFQAENGAWIGLRRGDDTQRKIGDDIGALNPVREHSTLSDWRARMIRDETLENWTFDEVWLFDGETFLFRGKLLTVDSDDASSETTLGGYDELVELDWADAAVTYQNELAWEALDDFITNETPFTADVTEPSASSTSEVLQDLTTASELQAASTEPATTPLVFNGTFGRLEQAQTGWILEAENGSNSLPDGATVTDSTIYSGDTAISSGDVPQDGDYWEVTFETEYEIDAADLAVYLNIQFPDSNTPGITVFLNGTQISQVFSANTFAGNESSPDYVDVDSQVGNAGTLQPGTHTVKVEITEVSSTPATAILDCVSIADTRFSKTFDNSVSSGVIQGPELYADGVQVFFDEVAGAYNLTDADVDTTWSATADAEYGVSFDSGASTQSVTDQNSANFTNNDNPTTSVQGFAVLNSKQSGDGNSPALGDQSTFLFDFKITGNGNTRGVIEDHTFVGRKLKVLQQLLDRAAMRSVLEYAEAGTSTLAAFKQGDVTGSASWVVGQAGRKRSVDVRDYANEVVVRGAEDGTGSRPEVTLTDSAEVSALASQKGVSTAEATKTESRIEPDLTSTEELKSVARTLLDRLVNEGDVTGRINIAPQLIAPGKSYTIPAWSETQALERVEYQLGVDGLSGTLIFERPDGLGEQLDETANETRTNRDGI